MSAALEQAAKKLIADPKWHKVFKNTWDILEGGINQCLLIIGVVAMAIRFASNVGSGHLVCILIGVEGPWNMTDISGPMAGTYSAYASLDPGCYGNIISAFDTYGSFVMMLEAVLLVGSEKINMIVPNLNQKLERFYKTVVEEMMLGKDPDVAEDIVEGVVSTDKILRSRQRSEICGALRGSSTIYRLYVGKNIFQVVLVVIFLFVNWSYGINQEKGREEGKICQIELKNTDRQAIMQCRQKWLDFFVVLLWIQMCFFILSIVCNLASLIWAIEATGHRKITHIIRTLQKADNVEIKKQRSNSLDRKMSSNSKGNSLHRNNLSMEETEQTKGEDLYFLFDLLAHSCGVPATLRVLSHTDDMFAKLCQPEIDFNVSENCLEVQWKQAKLQNIEQLVSFDIEKYCISIIERNSKPVIKEVAKDTTIYKFDGLEGGMKKYDVTLSVIIQKAIMKGSRTSTNLLPYPPQKLTLEPLVLKDNKFAQVRVRWTRPKGEFEKYSLKVTHVESKRGSIYPSMVNHFMFDTTAPSQKETSTIWIPNNEKTETEYTVPQLLPGERYFVELSSITGKRSCKEDKSLKKSFLTTPKPPKKVSLDTKSNNIQVFWEPPPGDGHSLVDGYFIELRDGDKLLHEGMQSKKDRSLILADLLGAQKYNIGIATVCRASTNGDTLPRGCNLMGGCDQIGETEYFEQRSNFTYLEAFTPPTPPTNLKLESTTPTKLNIKWDPPTNCGPNLKLTYSLSIHPLSPYVQEKMEDKTYDLHETPKFSFTGLPEIIGSGEPYEINVKANISLEGKNLKSTSLTSIFYTKPLPPERLSIINAETQEIAWYKSPSRNVKNYKIKLKGENDNSGTDSWVEIKPQEDGEATANTIPHIIQRELDLGIEYKVNIYSELEVPREGMDSIWLESEPLFMKIIKQNEQDNLEEGMTDVTDADGVDSGTVEKIILLKPNLITRKHTYITEDTIARQSVKHLSRPLSYRGSVESLPSNPSIVPEDEARSRKISHSGLPRQATISEDENLRRYRKKSNIRQPSITGILKDH